SANPRDGTTKPPDACVRARRLKHQLRRSRVAVPGAERGYPICADKSGNIRTASSRQLFHAWIPKGGNEYTTLPPPNVAIRTWKARVFASASASSAMPLRVL